MTELPRLKDGDDLAGALLRAADDDAPSPRSRAAIAAAIGLSAGAAGVGAGSAHAASSAAKTTLAGKLGATVTVKIAAVVIAVGATVGVHHVVTKPASEPPPPAPARIAEPAHAAVPTRAAAPANVVVVEPAPVRATVEAPAMPAPTPIAVAVPAAPPPVAHTPVAHTPVAHAPVAHAATRAPDPAPSPEPAPAAETPPAPPAPSLADEVALLGSAVAQLHRHDAGAALAILDDYDQRFPAGKLAPEATVARVEATFEVGDAAHARALAARFLAEHAQSPLAPRVRDLVAAHPR
jgi:hypothetical protein